MDKNAHEELNDELARLKAVNKELTAKVKEYKIALIKTAKELMRTEVRVSDCGEVLKLVRSINFNKLDEPSLDENVEITIDAKLQDLADKINKKI